MDEVVSEQPTIDAVHAAVVAVVAESLSEPADQPHGARHGIVSDPSGHRWMLPQAIEVVVPPTSPDDDPDGMVFTIRDPEGNLWSFGSYAGER